KKAVKVGETWPISAKDLATLLSVPNIDAEKSKATGKLVKAYRKGGKQWGVVEIKGKLGSKAMTGGPAISMDFTMTLDSPIDGSSYQGTQTMKGKMHFKFVQEQGGKKYTIENEADLSATSQITPVKKKEEG